MQFFQMLQAVFTPTSTVPSQHASVHGNFQVGNLKVKASVQPLVFILAFVPRQHFPNLYQAPVRAGEGRASSTKTKSFFSIFCV